MDTKIAAWIKGAPLAWLVAATASALPPDPTPPPSPSLTFGQEGSSAVAAGMLVNNSRDVWVLTVTEMAGAFRVSEASPQASLEPRALFSGHFIMVSPGSTCTFTPVPAPSPAPAPAPAMAFTLANLSAPAGAGEPPATLVLATDDGALAFQNRGDLPPGASLARSGATLELTNPPGGLPVRSKGGPAVPQGLPLEPVVPINLSSSPRVPPPERAKAVPMPAALPLAQFPAQDPKCPPGILLQAPPGLRSKPPRPAPPQRPGPAMAPQAPWTRSNAPGAAPGSLVSRHRPSSLSVPLKLRNQSASAWRVTVEGLNHEVVQFELAKAPGAAPTRQVMESGSVLTLAPGAAWELAFADHREHPMALRLRFKQWVLLDSDCFDLVWNEAGAAQAGAVAKAWQFTRPEWSERLNLGLLINLTGDTLTIPNEVIGNPRPAPPQRPVLVFAPQAAGTPSTGAAPGSLVPPAK